MNHTELNDIATRIISIDEQVAMSFNPAGFLFGAAHGNRTRLASLEGWSLTNRPGPLTLFGLPVFPGCHA